MAVYFNKNNLSNQNNITDCRLYSDRYIGSIHGTYFASVYSTSFGGDTIGKLSKIADEWKWIPWIKVQSFIDSSIAGIFSAENRTAIFINAKTNNEQAAKHLYFSVDSGNTWTELINREITQILNLNGYFIFYGNGMFSLLGCEDIDDWTSGLVTNSYPGSGFPTNPLIIVTDSKLMVYGSNILFVSNDNGMTWSSNTISASSSNWLKNEIISSAYGHGVTFANMYKFDAKDKTKTYYLYNSTNGIDWSLYPMLSEQVNCFIELLKKAKERKIYYFDTVDKFVCTGIYNNTNSMMYTISLAENGNILSYKINYIPETHPNIIQNRY